MNKWIQLIIFLIIVLGGPSVIAAIGDRFIREKKKEE